MLGSSLNFATFVFDAQASTQFFLLRVYINNHYVMLQLTSDYFDIFKKLAIHFYHYAIINHAFATA